MMDASLPVQTDAERRSALKKTASYLFAFVMLGMMLASLGPTLPSLAQLTETTTAQISILFTMRSVSSLAGMFIVGRLYDRYPGHPLIAGGLISMGVLLMLVPVVAELWWMIGVFLLIGFTESLLQVGGNSLVIWLHGHRVGPYTNALAFCFGVGAFLAPILIAQVLIVSGDIRVAYFLLGVCMIPPALVLLPQESPKSPAVVQRANAGDDIQEAPKVEWGIVLLIAFFFSIIVGNEVSIGGLLTSYGLALGVVDEVNGAYLASVFWVAITIGRLFAVPIAARVRPRTILLVDLIGTIFMAALMFVFSDQTWALWGGTIGIGLFTASIFPTMIALVERRMSLPARITSVFFAGASAGAMVIPWALGQVFAGDATILMGLLTALYLVAFAGLLFLLRRMKAPRV